MPKVRLKPSATRQVTGTSYETKGAQSRPPMDELGSSRLPKLYDPVPELGNKAQARQTFTKMKRADASVKTSLRAGKAPVLGADFYIEPSGDSPEEKLAAELVNFNLFDGMTITWLKLVEQILQMFEDGFEPFEQVWELREWAPNETGANRKKYTMLRKLAIRPSNTVKEISYDDNGGPTGIIQNAINAKGKSKETPIDINKLVIFTFDQEGGDLEGNSILRSAYEPWYYKYHLYKIDAIQKERHGIGIPDVELQPGYSEADRKFANELAKNLRTNEHAFIVRTNMMKVGFAELGSRGSIVNVLHSINHHDDMIMKNIMVGFLNMGITEGGGNRATSATSMDMFLKAMRYIAQSICDCFNMYVIPNLISYNFKLSKFPKLCVRNVGETKDLQAWASAMANLADKGVLQMDDETEQWVRQTIQAPRRTTPYVKVEKTTPVPFDQNQNGGGDKPRTGYQTQPPDQAPL